METKPRMSKSAATKKARGRLRWGHFHDMKAHRLWVRCPDCEQEVSRDIPYGCRTDVARDRVLLEALVDHLMDPEHDEVPS